MFAAARMFHANANVRSSVPAVELSLMPRSDCTTSIDTATERSSASIERFEAHPVAMPVAREHHRESDEDRDLHDRPVVASSSGRTG